MMPLLWLVVFAATAAFSTRKTGLAGILVVAALPAYLLRTSVFGLPTTLLEAAILGSLIGASFDLIRHHAVRSFFDTVRRHPFFYPALALLIVSAIEIFVPADRIAALGVWRAYFLEPILVLPLLYVSLKDAKTRTALFIVLAAETVALAAIALLQRVGVLPIAPPWDVELRATSIYPFPNAVGLFLGPTIVFFATLAALGKTWTTKVRAFFATAAIISSAGIVASMTKAAIGSVAIAIGVLGLTFNKKTRLATIVVALIALTMIVAVSPLRTNLIQKITFQEWSGTVRRVMWQETVAMLMTRPFLGAGLSGYPSAVAPFHPDKKVEIFQYPHDEFLNVWSELGVPGLAVALWILVIFVRTLRLKTRDADRYLHLAAALSILEILIHGLVDVPYFKNDLAILTWLFLLLPSAVSTATRRDR